MIRNFFSNRNDKVYFKERFLDIRSLIDVFQQKNDILRKLVNLQSKSKDFLFLTSKELGTYQNFLGRKRGSNQVENTISTSHTLSTSKKRICTKN